MNLHQIRGPNLYVRYLEENPHEVDILFKELLISVTCFFRDPAAYASLAGEVLPALFDSRPDNHTLRVWVPGCATGEEVYSLAILLRETIETLKRPFDVQLFGTDLDSTAIENARIGQYPDGIAIDLSHERLERYFTHDDNGYRIRKDIREMAIFAVQNVIKDPPFTKLDMISCRNLLIYLNSDLQKKLLPVFHYALKPDGILILGPSETIGGFNDLFDVVDKKWKIYRRKEVPMPTHAVMDFPLGPQGKHEEARSKTPAPQVRERGINSIVDRLLLNRFAPASVVVNERGDVVFIHGRTGRFLEPAPGQPRLNLHDMAREGLQLELVSALRQAATQPAEVVRENIRVRTNGGFSHVDLTVVRLNEPETLRGLFLVTFRDRPAPPQAEKPATRAKNKDITRVAELERELQHSKESLQITIEELETSNEELKSANEELQSTNEELQSTNEELETSKEEMQSLNEELTTVNAELHSKVEELSRANDDMQNLLNSTEIATIFLDRDLKINRFTEQAKRLVRLIQSDIGRPLADLASCLNYDQLVADCHEVLRTLVFKQAEVRTKDGMWYLMRIMPYRTAENVIDGLVLTFVDVNAVKKVEHELGRAKERLAIDLEAMTRLQDFGALFARDGVMADFLHEVLDTAIFITSADMGNIQIPDPKTKELKIVAQRGFTEEWLAFWAKEVHRKSACETAMRRAERVIVEDITKSPIFAGTAALDAELKAGVHAVQATPLLNREGEVVGVISTQFKQAHLPDERTLRLLDLLARLTAEILDRAAAATGNKNRADGPEGA